MEPIIQSNSNSIKLYKIAGLTLFTLALLSQIYIFIYNILYPINIGYLLRQQYALYAKADLIIISVAVIGLLFYKAKQKYLSRYIIISMILSYPFFFLYRDATFWNPVNNKICLLIIFVISQFICSLQNYKKSEITISKLIVKNIWQDLLFYLFVFYLIDFLGCIPFGCFIS